MRQGEPHALIVDQGKKKTKPKPPNKSNIKKKNQNQSQRNQGPNESTESPTVEKFISPVTWSWAASSGGPA